MSKFQLSRVGLIAAIVLGSAACSSGKSASTTSQAPASSPASSPSAAGVDVSKVTLRVGYSTSRGQTQQAVRLQSGAFDGTPYKIEWAEFPAADPAMEALSSGAIDVMLQLQPGTPIAAQANAKTPWTKDNAPYSLIGAQKYADRTKVEIIVHDGSGIKTVADLKGKKVAFAKGSISSYFWVLASREAGLTSGDVERALLSPSDARAAFKTGAVDAMVALDFNVVALKRAEGAIVIASSGDNVALLNLVAARRGLHSDPAVEAAVSDLQARIARNDQWAESHVADVRHLYETLDKIDPLDSEVLAYGGFETPIPLDDSVIAAFRDQADVFFAEGEIPTNPDVSILFDMTLPPKALPQGTTSP